MIVRLAARVWRRARSACGPLQIALALALGAPAPPAAVADDLADSVLVGRVIKVKDGDSLVVRLEGGPAGARANDLEVRLHGVDAPEWQQAGGRAAKRFLERRVRGQRVEIAPVTVDSYDRQIGVVAVAGVNVNAALVEAGHAWAYRRYLAEVPGADELCRIEAAARDGRRGLWSQPPDSWVPPWLYRKTRGPDSGDIRARSYAGETETDCRQAIPRARRPAAEPLAAAGDGPGGCRIKGNINTRGERIYHLPGSRWYADTRIDGRAGERWFCTEEEARAAGWRAAR